MNLDKCLVLGSEAIDSNTLNRCMRNLYKFIDERAAASVNASSENYPDTPFCSGGYRNALEEMPVLRDYGLKPATRGDPSTGVEPVHGVVERLYSGSLTVDIGENESFRTESATGAYFYDGDAIARFAPSSNTLFSDSAPYIFASLLDDDSTTLTTGVSSLGTATAPTIKFNSYMLCGYTGVAYGTITFHRTNGDVQNNVISLNIRRDLIGKDHVDTIRFFHVGNGYASGVRAISESGDMVSDISACTVTYVTDDDVVITDITKNDSSDTIRFDRATGRILGDDETRPYGEYVELPNDTLTLNYYVVFDIRKDSVDFGDSTWCFYICQDAAYARTRLYNADNYARGNIKYEFSGFEAADDGYVDMASDTHTYTQDGSHVCHNAVTTAKDAFNGCFNATFPLLCYFSSRLKYADRMFKDCHHATFDSLPDTMESTVLRTAPSMFEKCASAPFANITRISYPNATNLQKMFSGCYAAEFNNLESVCVNGNSAKFFYGCDNAEFLGLTSVHGGAYNLESFFEGCENAVLSSLEYVASDESGIVYASRMFYGLDGNTDFRSLGYINLSTGGGYVGDEMFYGCSGSSFENLQDIGNPTSAIGMFQKCHLATFEGLTTLGTKLRDGRHMFDHCSSLNMTIETDTDTLGNGGYMFYDVKSITVNGNMNGLVNAESMFANCELALVNGNMNNLVDGEKMFTWCTSALVYGSMERLVTGNSMFASTDYAMMASVPATLRDAIDMFAGTQSCCITEWEGMPKTGSGDVRVEDGCFYGSLNCAVTGNVLDGELLSTSRMFENAGIHKRPLDGGYGDWTDSGSIELCNVAMSGNPEDTEHRWFATNIYQYYSIYQEIYHDGRASDGDTTVFGMHTVTGDAGTYAKVGDSAMVALQTSFTGRESEYELYLVNDGHTQCTKIDTTNPTATYDGYVTVASNDERYFISSVVAEPSTDTGETEEDWFFYRATADVEELRRLSYSIAKKTKRIEDAGGGFSGIDCTISFRGTASENSAFVTINKPSGSIFNILVRHGTSEQYSYTATGIGVDEADVRVEVNFLSMNTDDIECVFTVVVGETHNSFRFYRASGRGMERFYINESGDLLLIQRNSPHYAIKLFQIYDDVAHMNAPFGYLLAMVEEQTKELKFMFYRGDFNDGVANFNAVQGDIYSIQATFAGEGSSFEHPRPSLEISIERESPVSKRWLYADRMFFNAVGHAVLSGYDGLVGPSLLNVDEMFALPEKYDEDFTFGYAGHLFSGMEISPIVSANGMFRNRSICSMRPFEDYTSYYSFHIPYNLRSADEMFMNTNMPADSATTEIGLYIPYSLERAERMFKDFSGPLVRFGYLSNGAVVFNDDIRTDEMFDGCSFANEIGDSQFTMSTRDLHIPVFRGSDFEYNDVLDLIDRSGCYFSSMPYGDGVFSIADKLIEAGAAFKSLTADITRWFDEGVYLASVLGPSDDNYRLQFQKYQMATATTPSDVTRLAKLAEYTNSFSANAIRTLNGGHRCACMFNPLAAIYSTPSEMPAKVGAMLYSFATVDGYGDESYAATRSFVEQTAGKAYRSMTFNGLRTTGVKEMAFMYSGLGSATFNSLSYVGGEIVNASAAFMCASAAEFGNLSKIEILHDESLDTVRSSFVEVSATPHWIGNYTNMFAACSAAAFDSLSEVFVKSQYYPLYPTGSGNSLLLWGDSLNGVEFRLHESGRPQGHETHSYTLTLTSHMPPEGGGERWAFRLSGRNFDDEQFEAYAYLNLLTSEYPDFNSICDVKIEFGEINKSSIQSEEKYKFAVIISAAHPVSTAMEYFTFTFDSAGDAVVDTYDVHPTEWHIYDDDHNRYDFNTADESIIYNYRGDTDSYKIQCIKDADSQYTFGIDYILDEKIVTFDTNVVAESSSSVEFIEDVEGDEPLLAVKFAACDTYYTYRPGSGIVEEDSLYSPSEGAYVEEYSLSTDAEEAMVFFGRSTPYKLELLRGGGVDAHYIFSIVRRENFRITTFRTDLSRETVDIKAVDVYEEYLTAEESGFSEDGNVLAIGFVDTGLFYLVHQNGEVQEHLIKPTTIQFKTSVAFNWRMFTTKNIMSHVDGMFRDCSSFSGNSLTILATAPQGSCSHFFENCSSLHISGLTALFLPSAYRSIDDYKCYRCFFKGVKASSIDLGGLTALDTNIHRLGWNGARTNGPRFFEGVLDDNGNELHILTSSDAITAFNLDEDIANGFAW